jgi:hypothetical protein
MSASSSHPSESRGTRLLSVTGQPEVKWIPSHASAQVPPPALTSSSSEATVQTERMSAAIVVALTLACTVLSIYDLVLLASGA